MTTAFNPWPFPVSVGPNNIVTGNTAILKTPTIDVGTLIWEAMVRNNAKQAAAIRANAPEALV